MKSKFYLILSNGLICIMLICLSFFAFVEPIESVVLQNVPKVFYNGNTESRNVSLMINVYWGNEYLDDLLSIFEKYSIKTTFFIGGVWAEKYSDELLKIYSLGHEIGNHGYFHKSHDKLTFEENQNEILSNHKLVKSLCGVDMNLFAPPSGAYSETTLQVAKNLGYKTIMWTRDTIDWRDEDCDLIFNRATRNLKGGDLILMHPTKSTAQALKKIIQYGQSLGFNFCTVSKCIGE